MIRTLIVSVALLGAVTTAQAHVVTNSNPIVSQEVFEGKKLRTNRSLRSFSSGSSKKNSDRFFEDVFEPQK